MKCKICEQSIEAGDLCTPCWEVTSRLETFLSHKAGRRRVAMVIQEASKVKDKKPGAKPAPQSRKQELEEGLLDASQDTTPDWGHKCENCEATPVVPCTGLCGPCTFGEAETAGGNW